MGLHCENDEYILTKTKKKNPNASAHFNRIGPVEVKNG